MWTINDWMIPSRKLLHTSSHSTNDHCTSLGSTAARKQADFKETLWNHNDPVACKWQTWNRCVDFKQWCSCCTLTYTKKTYKSRCYSFAPWLLLGGEFDIITLYVVMNMSFIIYIGLTAKLFHRSRVGCNISASRWILELHSGRNLAVFTRSAITPPKVNRFGWNLEHSEYIVGCWPWHIFGAIRSVATVIEVCDFFVH